MKKRVAPALSMALLAVFSLGKLTTCTQEQQGKISRSSQNWFGTNGVPEIYVGDIFFELPR